MPFGLQDIPGRQITVGRQCPDGMIPIRHVARDDSHITPFSNATMQHGPSIDDHFEQSKQAMEQMQHIQRIPCGYGRHDHFAGLGGHRDHCLPSESTGEVSDECAARGIRSTNPRLFWLRHRGRKM